MKKSTVSLLIFIPIIITAQVIDFETIGFIPNVVDARSSAMGKTSIVSANGSNAIFSNPALISTFKERQVQFGGRLMMGTMKEEWREEYYESYDFKMTPDFTVNHFSYSTPYQLKGYDYDLTIGIGYRTYFDWGGNTKSKAIGENGDRRKTSSETSGGLNVITPTVAIKFQDKYYLGVSYSKSIFGNIIERYELTHTGYDNYKDETEIEHSGSFLQFGGFGIINQNLSFGITYRPEFEWEWEEIKYTVNSSVYSEKNFDITIPSIFGFGFVYKKSELLTIVGEYQTRNYSDMEFDNAASNIDDGACYRVGAEYQSTVLLRFGFYKDAVLITDYDDDEPKSAIGFTSGFGYDLGVFYLDTFIDYSILSVKYKKYDEKYKDTVRMLKVGVSLQYYL